MIYGSDAVNMIAPYRAKSVVVQFLIDCMHQARAQGNHPLAPILIDSTLLYGKTYVRAGVGLDSSLRRGVQSMGRQCISWEEVLVSDVHGKGQRLVDCLWSISGSPEDSRYSGPYDEALEVFSPEAEVPREIIYNFLSQLHPREEKVIRLRFGIGERHDHTLEEAGEVLHKSRERVRQIETKGMQKLSRALRAFADQETSLLKQEKGAVEQKVTQKQGVRYRKKLKNPVFRARESLEQHSLFSREDKKLIYQLNGWFGYEKTSFAEVVAARRQSWAELATQANNLSRRMRRLGVWSDAPMYPMEENID